MPKVKKNPTAGQFLKKRAALPEMANLEAIFEHVASFCRSIQFEKVLGPENPENPRTKIVASTSISFKYGTRWKAVRVQSHPGQQAEAFRLALLAVIDAKIWDELKGDE